VGRRGGDGAPGRNKGQPVERWSLVEPKLGRKRRYTAARRLKMEQMERKEERGGGGGGFWALDSKTCAETGNESRAKCHRRDELQTKRNAKKTVRVKTHSLILIKTSVCRRNEPG